MTISAPASSPAASSSSNTEFRRRGAVTAVVASLVFIVLSSCSTASSDAARVGDRRLSDDTFQDVLEGYSAATQTGGLQTGNLDANTARIILLDWISTLALEQTLGEYGVEISDADLQEAQRTLDPQPGFADAPAVVQAFYIRATAVRTVAGTTFDPDPEELADLYARGPEESGVACLRLILTDTKEALDAALARIAAGEAFADVAADVSTDPSTEVGGALTNNETGDECFPYADIIDRIVEPIGAALPDARPGVTTGPLEIPDVGWVAFVVRPYTEVSDSVASVIGPITTQRLADSALDNAAIWVNPQYGRWDPESRQVVARD